jgi:GcrA cell cycle regulator
MRRNNPNEFDWTDAAIARLKELWAEGLPASECGKRLGVSRNSVIGKIHRLGLSHKYRRPRERRPRMRARAKPAQNLLKIEQNIEQPVNAPEIHQHSQAVGAELSPVIGCFDLLELRSGMCRYPSGDRVPFAFCGAKQTRDSSYCSEHHAMAHSRGSQRDFDRQAEQALAGKLFASRAGIEQ